MAKIAGNKKYIQISGLAKEALDKFFLNGIGDY